MRPSAAFLAVADRQRRLIEACQKGSLDNLPGLAARQFALPLGVNKLGIADSASQLVDSSVDDDSMSATFVVSTVQQDRDGDIVVPRGCLPSLARGFKRNPVAFWDHQQNPIPIGLWESPEGELSLRVEEDQISATCWFDKGSAFAREIFRLVSKKLIRTTSIGFMPIMAERLKSGKASGKPSDGVQWPGWMFKLWDLLEISIVGVPANPDALRVELQKGKYSRRVTDALDRYAAAPAIWANGYSFESEPMKPKKTKAKPKTKARGNDIQAVKFPKKKYPEKAACEQWLENHDKDASNLTETDDAWIYEQFPESQCAVLSARWEVLHKGDGVFANICQYKIEAPAKGAEVANNPMEDDEDEDDVETAAMDPTAEEPVDEDEDEDDPNAGDVAIEPPAEEQDAAPVPPGAQLLGDMLGYLGACRDAISHDAEVQEHPEVVAFIGDSMSKLDELYQATSEACASIYPEHDFGLDGDEEESIGEDPMRGEDEDLTSPNKDDEEDGKHGAGGAMPPGAEGDSEEEEDAQHPKRRRVTGRVKLVRVLVAKRPKMARKHLSKLADVADDLEEISSDEMKRSHKRVCEAGCSTLRSIVEEAEGSGDEPEPDAGVNDPGEEVAGKGLDIDDATAKRINDRMDSLWHKLQHGILGRVN